MPHCLFRSLDLPKFPLQKEGYDFLAEFHREGGGCGGGDGDFALGSDLRESLIWVRFAGHEFFLKKRYRRKQGDFILKCEKVSRHLPIGIIKKAIRILASFCPQDILIHNLDNETPRQSRLSAFYKNAEDCLALDRSFALEIGFGSGRHLLSLAQENPSLLFVGIELHTPSIEQVLRQIELRGLENVWIVNFDARVFLELLPANLLEAIYLHFPVPWNKKPHRRVWSKRFLQEALRVLAQGGLLELRSDDAIYFHDALSLALEEKTLACRVSKNLAAKVVSKYEDRWLRVNKDIFELQITADFSLQNPVQRQEFTLPSNFSLASFDTIPRKLIGGDWFLHIDSFYSNQEASIVMLSFGDFHQPQKRFLLIPKSGEMRYLGGRPLPSASACKAHCELLRILKQGEDL